MSIRVMVLGAGSAGCVVASRLSERTDVDVVLLEAGADYPRFEDAPVDIRDNSILGAPDHDWGFTASAGGVPVPFPRGKVVGGSSAVNATNALRPLASDFHRWVAGALPEWSWEHALAAFVELERDDAPGAWHGTRGRVPIARYADAELHPLQRAFVEAAVATGHARLHDLNEPGAVGVGPTPMNREGRTRMTSARTHLDERVRARPNLSIVAHSAVDRLAIRDGRITAVHLADGRELVADAFVVSAGSIGSPAILLRSGIGGDELAELGIEQHVRAPRVGRGLREHPAVYVVYEAPDSVADRAFPVAQTLLTASSGLTDDSAIDLHVIPLTVGAGQLVFMVCPVRAHSLGSVTLAGRAASAHPAIELALFADERDRAIARRGIELTRGIAESPALAALVGRELAPGRTVVGDGELDAVMTTAPALYYHASCTCAMGPVDDPLAVVDPFGKINGIDNGWVIDASIFPDLPTTPTNMATMMLAQRCADALAAQL